jgi:hypothetical protein
MRRLVMASGGDGALHLARKVSLLVSIAASVACTGAQPKTHALARIAPEPSSADVGLPSCRFVPVDNPGDAHLGLARGSSSVVRWLVSLFGGPLDTASVDQEQALVCELLKSDWADVPTLLKARAQMLPPAPGCAIGESLFGAPDGDGRFHLIGFPGNAFVSLFEPGTHEYLYPATSWSLERVGGFAIHGATRAAFVCPTNESDLCVAWNPRMQEETDSEPGVADNAPPNRFFCTDERALECQQHGYDSEVYALDPNSGRTLKFGPFEREDLPVIVAFPDSPTITITTASCRTELTP